MNRKILKALSLFALVCVGVQCKNPASANSESFAEVANVNMVDFSGDSAYKFVDAQCSFGARVPGTAQHTACGDYLENEMKKYGDVTVQSPTLTAFNGKSYKARNIITAINPDSARRVLLLAHWDSRPWADADADAANHSKPVPGANDGASGVGVLMELARIFSANPPKVGVDIMFVDMEDMGTEGDDTSWALGTQYWVNNRHLPGYRPMFGILLDMVGAKDAHFEHEIYSKYYAPQVLSLVWDTAAKSGYGKYFKNSMGGGVTDDHVFINQAGIPTIDIIDSNSGNADGGFFPYWHTTRDDMSNISAETLKAVGQTVANVIYAL